MATAAEGSMARIAASRDDIGGSSTAARIARLLREQITDGELVPGERLREGPLSEAAGVSRNTTREAFRLLAQEGLVVHEFNRGVFVRRLTATDLNDVYRVRRILECEGVRGAAEAGPEAIARVSAAVAEGERAAEADRWRDVATADIRFHRALAALCDSPRVDDMMERILAELRLVFHAMGPRREFHGPYLRRNRTIADLLERGDTEGAERELRDYLDTAQEQLGEAYRRLEQ
ncbi:GntR family transcriptional regulator [Spirillospora sp. CA-294931]|uniref:GntR family transcriptional regulator n=1 Tax=Spirillospora sp. CA-294931 TaxID=3240042 RepID=UPI003D8D373B